MKTSKDLQPRITPCRQSIAENNWSLHHKDTETQTCLDGSQGKISFFFIFS